MLTDFHASASGSSHTGSSEIADVAASASSGESSFDDISASSTLPPAFSSVRVSSFNDGDDVSDDLFEQVTLGRCTAHNRDQVHANLERLLQTAADNGFPAAAHRRLQSLVRKHADTFRLGLPHDPPIKAAPVVVNFKPGIHDLKPRFRKYPPAVSDAVHSIISELESAGLIYPNPTARISSPVLPVRKSGADASKPIVDQYRLAVDLRAVNSQTVISNFPLPDIHTFASYVKGAQWFATADVSNAFWSLELDPSVREFFSLSTDRGTWTPTRVLQGSAVATGPFHSAMLHILGPLVNNGVLLFVDDILLYASGPDALVELWSDVLSRLSAAGVKLSASKTQLAAREVKFVGRTFSAHGVKFNQSFINSVTSMQPPRTVADLQTFIASCNWIRASIPSFSRLVAPLQTLLNDALAALPSRSKQHGSKVLLGARWTSEHQTAFLALLEAVSHSVTLSYPDSAKTICVHSDASYQHYFAIVTQVVAGELLKPRSEQQHEALSFTSGTFTASQLKWDVPTKELYGLLQGFTRNDHLLRGVSDIQAYTDHANLVHMIAAPPDSSTGSARVHADKIARWLQLLSAYHFELHHVDGVKNWMADYGTRAGAPPVPATAFNAVKRRPPALPPDYPAHVRDDVPSQFDTDVAVQFDVSDAPTFNEILSAQDEAFTLDCTEFDDYQLDRRGAFVTADNALYVPNLRHLRLRCAIVCHQGAAAHRGIDVTLKSIRRHFYWPEIDTDIHRFVSTCLQCLATRGGATIPRPLRTPIHATYCREVLHVDSTSPS